MKKSYKSFIIFFIIIILILIFFLKKYNDIVSKDKIDILVSNKIELINNELSYQKKNALSLAILFSKNHNIVQFLKSNNYLGAKQELNDLISTISNYTKVNNIQIQVHTKDLKVFVRSWEDKDTGMNLRSFRHGLVKVKQTQQPFVSNELGKRFNIKAISPIFDNEEYIGSLEVIIDFSSLIKRLKIYGIDILPLLDNQFLDIALYHKNNQKLNQFVVIEKNYDQQFFDLLHHHPELFKTKEFYTELENKIIVHIPFINIDGQNVGILVAGFNKENLQFNYMPNYEYTGMLNHEISYEYQPNKKSHINIK